MHGFQRLQSRSRGLSVAQLVCLRLTGRKETNHTTDKPREPATGNAKSHSRQKPLFAGYLNVNFQKSRSSKTSHNFVARLETREVDLWQVQPIRNWQNQGGELAPVSPPHMSATHPLSYRDIIQPRQQQIETSMELLGRACKVPSVQLRRRVLRNQSQEIKVQRWTTLLKPLNLKE